MHGGVITPVKRPFAKMNSRKSVRQEQPTKTSVISGDTQVHAVVTSAPETGKLIPVPIVRNDAYRHYKWLHKPRPNWDHAEKHGLNPDFLADEQKCRLLFERGEKKHRYKSCLPISLDSASDLLVSPCGSRCDSSIPTLDWFEEPYIKVKHNTCRRKPSKKIGTDHLKTSVMRSVQPFSTGCGVKGGKIKQRLHTLYSKIGGASAPAVVRTSVKATTTNSRGARVVERQQMDDGSNPPLLRILQDEEDVWRRWDNRPIATLLSIHDTILDFAKSSGIDVVAKERVFVEQLCPDATSIYITMRGGALEPRIAARKREWIQRSIFAIADLGASASVSGDRLVAVLRNHRKLDDTFAKMETHANVQFKAGDENSFGAWLSYFVPSYSSRNCLPAGRSRIMAALFPNAKVNVFNTIPFRRFVPQGVPPHWEQGGVTNLVFRAVMWVSTDFTAVDPKPDLVRVSHILRSSPALSIVCVSRALRNLLQEDGGIDTDIDIGPWIEENVYHRRNEYTTLLENLLQQDVPYWSKIEPVIISFSMGWTIFNGLKTSTISARIASALAVVIQSYTQHALASRCFCEMLKNVKSLLYKGLRQIVAVLESVWRAQPAENRQQMDENDPMGWFSKLCACMDSEFTTKLLQAFSFVGAIMTCPWKNLGEGHVTEWSIKALSYITTAAGATAKKFSFLEKLFELVKFFFIRAKLAWQYKDFSLFLYGKDEFNDLINKVNTLVKVTEMLPYMSTTWSEAIVDGVPFNLPEYKKLLGEIGLLAKQINKDLKDRKIKSLPTTIAAAMSRYAACVATYESLSKNQRNRPLPYVLFMVGPPSAGKNTLLEEVVEKLFKVCDFPKAIYELVDGVPTMKGYEMKKVEPCVWTANAFDEYASGFTNMHNVVSFIEPTLAAASTADGVKHSFSQVASFFSFVDTAPYSPVMAGVDEKGKMTSNGILFATVSANDESFNKWMLNCQMALLRRVGRMLVCLPYQKFKDSTTEGLDRNKIRQTEFKTDDDMWFFVVKKPKGLGQWNERETTSSADWCIDADAGESGYIYTQRDLMDWLAKRVRDHFREQMNVMQKAENVKHAKCCELDWRSGHDKYDHCLVCNSLVCGRMNADAGVCMQRVSRIYQGQHECNICGETSKVGCICCDEINRINEAVKVGELVGQAMHSKASIAGIDGRIMPSHCFKCYRFAKCSLMGSYECYSCANGPGSNKHSLRGAFKYGLSLSPVDLSNLDDDDIVGLLESADGVNWCSDVGKPLPYCQGHQQMKSDTMCALAGGVVLGATLALSLSRRKFQVEHHIRSPALDAIGRVASGVARAFNLPNAPGVAYPEPLCEMSEESWFSWAIGGVDAFKSFLCGFTIEQWMKFVGIVSLIAGVYTLAKYQAPQITQAIQSVKQSICRGDICSVIISARRDDAEQQMGLFDSNFIKKVLESHGLTTGARASRKSPIKIDNPWLSQATLPIRVNFGKRMGHLGVKNCEQSVNRIERSIYIFGCVPALPLDAGDVIDDVDNVKATRIHALLLSGDVFIVNTHFWIHSFVDQVARTLSGKSDRDREKTLDYLLDLSDWDEFREKVVELGVDSVNLVYDRVFDVSTFDDAPGSGVSAHTWECVHINQIAGCISTDISLVRLSRVARNQKGGLVYNLDDISRGLLIPREHTAPTDSVLFPGDKDGEIENVGAAVYTPKLVFSANIRKHEREYLTEGWTIRLARPTKDGDCGLPLMGVHHTKYTTVDGVKVIDPAGDTVAVLGMHRIYAVGRQMSHCAPLSIDMISNLLGKLDRNDQQIAYRGLMGLDPVTRGEATLYRVRTFAPGDVPSAGYKVNFQADVAAADICTEPVRVPISFKSGTSNVYHDKSPLQWMGKGLGLDYAPDLGEAVALHGEAVGSVGGFRQGQFKSSVTRLPTANYFGFDQKHCAPDLNNKFGKEMNLVAMAGAHNGDLNVNLLRRIATDMFSETILGLDHANKSWRDTVHPLTDVESIVGSSEANFTPGINQKTGMGFPFYGPKQEYVLIRRDIHGEIESIAMRDEVLHEVKNMMDAYSSLTRANPVFTATPKDERLGESKIIPVYDINGTLKCNAHNMRIFLCGSYPFVHLQRQQYLSIIRLICDYPETFEMAVGTNVASERWGMMKDWLTWSGQADEHILAGDYSKFDKRMTCTWITVAFEYLLSIMRESGNYTEGDMRIAEGIAADTANPLIDWFGDWFFITNGHPSGHALTTIINGIVNRLYLRYAYYKLWALYHHRDPMECVGYRTSVRTYVYGDDNISGVVGVARNFYTMPAICGVLRRVGVILTTEDKSAVIDDFTNIRCASFLKRSWRSFGGENSKEICAPLARKSLEAMVTVGVLNTQDTSGQMYSILRSFCDEYFHYGRDEFNVIRSKTISLCLDSEYWVREGFPLVGIALRQQIMDRGDQVFPTYDELLYRMQKAKFVPMRYD